MDMKFPEDKRTALFEIVLALGDDRLVLGHRLSEWCGHAPILEEDLALANIALDLLGQASAFLKLAGEIEGRGRSEDDLAYLREAIEFRNLQLVEQPNGDFAHTIARQFFFDAFASLYLRELAAAGPGELADIAAKSAKENSYHLRHSSQWMLRLGDGTEESHARLQKAFAYLWPYALEAFDASAASGAEGLAPDPAKLFPEWEALVRGIAEKATIEIPRGPHFRPKGSRKGFHSEHLGKLLAEMQILPRSYPGASW